MTTAAAAKPRTLLTGGVDGDWYRLVLDGDDVVFTQDRTIATAAAEAKRAGRAFAVEIEIQDGRRVVVDLQQVIDQPPATTAVAKPNQQAGSAPASGAALTRAPQIPTGLICDPEALSKQLTALQKDYHVMSPAISVSQMAPGFGANLAVVQIDTTVTFNKERTSATGPDTYWSKTIHAGDENKRSLRKEGILKLGQAIGVQWVPEYCRRTDTRKEPFLWAWQYFGAVRTHDGQVMPLQGSYELDLRDGSAAAKAMTNSALSKARQNGNEVCETKAMLRALRTLGIQQAYTVDELKKPFLIVRFSFTPDMADPEIKKLVTQQVMSGIGALYTTPSMGALPGPSSAPALPAADLPDVFSDVTDDTPAASTKGQPQSDEGDGRPIGGRKVLKVDKFSKPPAKWVGYTVTFDDDVQATTFEGSIAQIAMEARDTKAWVRATTEESPKHPDRLDLTSLSLIDPAEQDLPLGINTKEL